jgi:broad specificity phosphatase PhoE
MSTTKIMLIRHAEKPDGAQGVMPNGSAEPEALIVRGWQRAGALIGLFAPTSGHFTNAALARPASLFASGVGHHSNSLRPQQTLMPLAKKLGIAPNTQHLKGDEAALVQAATTIGGIVLVAWEHEAIPEIAQRVMGGPHGIPQDWPEKRFDLVWVFDRLAGDGNWHFTQVTQQLLAGDSTDPLLTS